MKLLVLSIQISFLAVCLGNVPDYEYPQPEGISLQQSLAYMPQQYAIESNYQQPQPIQQIQQIQQQPQYNYAPIEESYKKQFFIFSAPDEDFEDHYVAQKISSTVQKNVRVVFIRAPEQKGLEQAALQLAKQASDDKTAIYVLSKQTDVGELAHRLSAHREQYTHKPEVHFVKYRTPEDAAHAQQQIQAQYDSLRGTSHTSNEGAAPVLNFVTQQQQPSYGSAISVVPAYAGVTNAGSNVNGYYGQQVATSNVGLGGIGGYNTGGYGTVASHGGLNSFSSFKTVGYNTNSLTSTSSGGYGEAAGYGNIGYNTNVADNAAISTAFNGYGDARAANTQQLLAENSVSKLNERVNTGGKLSFPTEGTSENVYLPPLKRRQ